MTESIASAGAEGDPDSYDEIARMFAGDDLTEQPPVDSNSLEVGMSTLTQDGFPTLKFNGAIIMFHNPPSSLASEEEEEGEADMSDWDFQSPWACRVNLLHDGSTALDFSLRRLGTITLTPQPPSERTSDESHFFEAFDSCHALTFLPADWQTVQTTLNDFANGSTKDDFKPSDVSGTWYKWRQDTGQEYEELKADAEIHFRPVAVEPDDVISHKRNHSSPPSEDADQETETRIRGKKARLESEAVRGPKSLTCR